MSTLLTPTSVAEFAEAIRAHPAVLAIGLLTDRSVVLGLDPVDVVLLLLTLGLSTITFASGRTNILLGAVHLLLFCSYLMLLFER